MNELEIIEIVRHALVLTLQIGTAPMMVGLIVGVVIALFQALTQIQEMTLVFVPKIIAMFASLFFLLPMMMQALVDFMHVISAQIIAIQ
jgi:flagellar biosynthetic protein FliQ